MRWLAVILGASLVTTTAYSQIAVEDWLAFGSGCQSRKDNVTGIDLQIVKNKDSTELVFGIKPYELSGSRPVSDSRATFARECAFRVALQPSPGHQIVGMSLATDFVMAKDKGAAGELTSRLIAAGQVIGQDQTKLAADTELKGQVVHIATTSEPSKRDLLASLPCGSSRLLGADLSLMVRREDFKPKVSIRPLSGQLRLIVQTAKCPT